MDTEHGSVSEAAGFEVCQVIAFASGVSRALFEVWESVHWAELENVVVSVKCILYEFTFA